eukprot:15480747-Alexandrium_andersonii.AAC.1
MSASLVCSEMCIRDSSWPLPSPRLDATQPTVTPVVERKQAATTQAHTVGDAISVPGSWNTSARCGKTRVGKRHALETTRARPNPTIKPCPVIAGGPPPPPGPLQAKAASPNGRPHPSSGAQWGGEVTMPSLAAWTSGPGAGAAEPRAPFTWISHARRSQATRAKHCERGMARCARRSGLLAAHKTTGHPPALPAFAVHPWLCSPALAAWPRLAERLDPERHRRSQESGFRAIPPGDPRGAGERPAPLGERRRASPIGHGASRVPAPAPATARAH